MVRDHEAVNKQALALVKKLGVTPEDNDTSKALNKQAATKKAELDQLTGAAFDKAYMANEVAYHVTVNGAVEKVLIPSSTNGELKSLLQTGLKIFQGTSSMPSRRQPRSSNPNKRRPREGHEAPKLTKKSQIQGRASRRRSQSLREPDGLRDLRVLRELRVRFGSCQRRGGQRDAVQTASVTGVLLLTGAGSVSAGREPAVVQIVIDKVAFAPLKKPLTVGDIVEWVNNDVVDHTATEKVAAKDKGWDVVVRVGRTVRVEMKKPGKVDYICRFHPNMTGQIEVRAK